MSHCYYFIFVEIYYCVITTMAHSGAARPHGRADIANYVQAVTSNLLLATAVDSRSMP